MTKIKLLYINRYLTSVIWNWNCKKIIYEFKDGQIFNETGIYLYTLLCCSSSEEAQKIFYCIKEVNMSTLSLGM